MAVGRISGPLLKANLLRNGIDLAFENDLLYLDVNNQRLGVKTTSPAHELDISGTARTTNLLSGNIQVDDIELDASTVQTTVGDLTVQGATQFDKVSIPRVAIPDVQGDVTVSGNLETTGNIHAQGNITADGNITLGNEDTDNVSFNADINSDITPDATDTYRFGSPSKRWINGHFREINAGDVTISTNTISPSEPDQDLVIKASGTGNVVIAGLAIDTGGNVDLSGDRLFVGNALLDGDADRTGLIARDSNTDLFLESAGTGSVFANGVDLLNTQGNSYYVSVNGSDTNSGESEIDAFASVSTALQQSTAGDIVYVGSGVFEETTPLSVPAGVTVQGAGIRSTQLKPKPATRTSNFFLLDGETAVEDLTVREIEWNDSAQTGYAFSYKSNAKVTRRSAYMRNVTVLNFGSSVRLGTNAQEDPYGFDAGDAGRGALVDGSMLDPQSQEAGMLFDSATFIVPNSYGLEMTNGARVELLNSFVYFADVGIQGVSGTAGKYSDGKTVLDLAGVSGTIQAGDSATFSSTDDSTVITVAVDSVEDNSRIFIDGRNNEFEGFDFTPASITFSPSGATAEEILRYDRTDFGAELRSIASANVYGNFGVRADGPGVRLRLSSHDFGYIGAGKKFNNNDLDVSTVNEVTESNGGRVFYTSTDQYGDYRVGDAFTVNQDTGEVTFEVGGFDVTSLTGITFTDNSNETVIDPVQVQTGNLRLTGNTLESLSGNITIDPVGSNDIELRGDVDVTQTLDVADTITGSADLSISGNSQFGGTVDIDSQTTVASINVEDLTENRVPVVGVNGELQDTAELTYNGDTLFVDADARVTGNLDVDGDITLQGNIKIGDTNVDTVEVAADFTSNLVPDKTAQFDLGSISKTWRALYATKVEINSVTIDDNYIRTNESNADLQLIPNGAGTVVIDTDTALQLPVGTTTERTPGTDGEIRFNSEKQIFEGHSNGVWINFQGLEDADEDTFIRTEEFPGSDDDTLSFFTADTLQATLDNQEFDLQGNRSLFANEYGTFADLPDAFTYTGMFAYVTATNKAYFARFGEWIEIVAAREDFDIDGNLTANDVKIGNTEITNVLSNGNLNLNTNGSGEVRYNGTEVARKGDNVSEFVNDAEYIDLTDLTAVGDITYDSNNGVFSVTTYKTSDFDNDFANSSFDDLSDTAFSNKAADELIRWSGTNWINFELTLDYVSDVDTAGVGTSDLLVYDGTNWSISNTVNIDTVTGSLDVQGNLDTVGDVTTTTLNTDDVRIFENTVETTRNDLDLELRADGSGVIKLRDATEIQGSLTVSNNLTASGNTTFGSSSLNTIDFVGDISSNIIPETATQTLGSSTTAWQNLFVGNMEISDSNITALDNDANLSLTPNGVGYVDIDTTTALLIPTGTTSERPTNVQGMIRYNTDDERFEAYNGTAWTGLGGVIDVDQDTFIIAETSPGSDNDQLEFFAGGSQIATFDADGIEFNSPNTNTISTTSGDLILDPAPAGSQGAVIIQGDLNVEGTTTTINSTITTLDDPVITLGGDENLTTNDGKDRGVEFRYYSNGARLGFFGYDENQAVFKFIPDATNLNEVFSGAVGDVEFRDAALRDITADSITLSTQLAVEDGGTGNGTFTVNGILYGNGTSAVQVTDAAGTADATTSNELLTVDGTGTPVWTDTIDEGTY